MEEQLEESVSNILEGLSNFEQVVLIKQRWEEMKKLRLGLVVVVKDKKIVKVNYSPVFEVLYREHQLILRSNWLPKPCLIITSINIEKIIETLQNTSYMGVLRQRWEEIRKLRPELAVAV